MDSSRRRKRPGDGRDRDLEAVKSAIEKRLFIGKLLAETTEAEIQGLFSEFGELTECKKVPGKTMAFVGYASWAAAHRALQATDGKVSIQGHAAGQTIVASFAERTSTVGRGGGAHLAKGHTNSRIFVGGLPEEISDDELKTFFEPFGHVTGISLLPAKSTKRCGFVNFELWGEALDAIEALDARPLPGQDAESSEVLTVVLADPKPGQEAEWGAADEGPAKRRRLDNGGGGNGGTYGGGGSGGSSRLEEAKRAYLFAVEGDASEQRCTELHWNLMAARTISWASAGAPWAPGGAAPVGRGGFGAGGAAAAPVGRRPAPAARQGGSGNPRDDPDAARLFIGGLPVEVNDDELNALVGQIPLSGSPSETALLECRVLPGRGCGYLRFASWGAAEEAQEALNERSVNGWPQPLRAKWATPKPGAGGGDAFGGEPWGRPPAVAEKPRRSAPAREGRGGGGGSAIGGGETERQRLFVGQLAYRARKDDIIALFDSYGSIEEFKYLEDKGVCYVTYADESGAKRACQELNGKSFEGLTRGEGLNVQFAKPNIKR